VYVARLPAARPRARRRTPGATAVAKPLRSCGGAVRVSDGVCQLADDAAPRAGRFRRKHALGVRSARRRVRPACSARAS
jgi:hypothetical protein